MLFPMYVVRVDSFLEMREAIPHQVLRRRGLVFEYDPCEGAIGVFVSHEWCGRQHPDPYFRQLSTLQNMFRRAAARRLVVEPDFLSAVVYRTKASIRPADFQGCLTWRMWYDYFSVPQPDSPQQPQEPASPDISSDLTHAISSLHAYVALSKYFLVLAPVVQHENGHFVHYRSWKSRGWCRFERLAHVMTSPDNITVLICEGEELLVEMGAHDFLYDPVGRGDFSVDSDRERLALPAKQLVEGRLRSLLARGDTRTYMRLMSWSLRLMDGLSTRLSEVRDMDQQQTDRGSAEGFLQMMHFEEPAARVHGTWPLLVATRMGNVSAMRGLLQCRADVACKEAWNDGRFRVLKGQRAVHIAAESGHLAALELLLEHRADVNVQCGFGLTPMHMIGFGGAGAPEIGKALLKHRADINRQNKGNNAPLFAASTYDHAEAVEFLLRHGAALNCNQDGHNALHAATLFRARASIVSMLLDAGVSPNDRVYPKMGSLAWLILMLQIPNYRLGRRGFITLLCHHYLGATPLMTAAMTVHTEAATILLRAHADPEARNSQGATARTLAEIFGGLKGMSSDVGRFFDNTALDKLDGDLLPQERRQAH